MSRRQAPKTLQYPFNDSHLVIRPLSQELRIPHNRNLHKLEITRKIDLDAQTFKSRYVSCKICTGQWVHNHLIKVAPKPILLTNCKLPPQNLKHIVRFPPDNTIISEICYEICIPNTLNPFPHFLLHATKQWHHKGEPLLNPARAH